MEVKSHEKDAEEAMRFELDTGADIDMRLMNYLNSLDDFITLYNDIIGIITHQNMSMQEKSSALSRRLADEIQEKKNGMYKYIISAAKKKKFIGENANALPVDSKLDIIDEKCRKLGTCLKIQVIGWDFQDSWGNYMYLYCRYLVGQF